MNLCLVGYGIIGKAWHRHYVTDGYALRLWNRSPQNLPEFVPDLLKAAEGADVIHIVVADPPAVQDIIERIAPVLRPETLVIQSSTISPSWATIFQTRVESLGASYVEAPFTGSKVAAENRQNIFYLGGRPQALERAETILAGLSKLIRRLGTVEQACALKLAMNLQIASISQALIESLTLARSYQIPDDLYFELLENNVSHSGLSELKKNKLLTADYRPQFSLKHLHKDLALALQSTEASRLPLTAATLNIYQQGLEAGLGEEDFIALIKLLTRDNTSP
jgi:3-hydroxyisobutyrate dehydrogenase-like beta-hydroxyacid dehydrogenase